MSSSQILLAFFLLVGFVTTVGAVCYGAFALGERFVHTIRRLWRRHRVARRARRDRRPDLDLVDRILGEPPGDQAICIPDIRLPQPSRQLCDAGLFFEPDLAGDLTQELPRVRDNEHP